VLGVRLAIKGLKLIGVNDSKGKERKDFIVFVEIDRCATDAIQSVTGCSLGKRSLKWKNFGVMAATFFHMKRDIAYRIVAREESRELASKYCPEIEDKYRRQLEAYKLMSDDELFSVQQVKVEIPECDLPGRPMRRVQCELCGDYVQDCREVERDGKNVCRSCAGESYYTVVEDMER
jgi:formylmethanofuran dehydrogenase subunit E